MGSLQDLDCGYFRLLILPALLVARGNEYAASVP